MRLKDRNLTFGVIKFWKRICAYVGKHFDKAFFRGTWRQFEWLLVLLIVGSLLLFGIGNTIGIGKWRIVELILDPGSFAGAYKDTPQNTNYIKGMWFQLTVTLFGAVTFTCLLINTIGNWLERRMDRYRSGGIAYEMDDHILILGAGSKVVGLIKTLLDRAENANCDIVILTSVDAEELRAHIFSAVPKKYARNIYVYYGSRVRKETLHKLEAYQARAIYILGEEEESAHDSLNMKCYELLRDDVCKQALHTIDCYMILDSLTSIQLFYCKQNSASSDKLYLTVVNSLENVAQRVLVSRYYRDGKSYPSLDREGISKDSNQFVHLIVVNMSPIGYAMAVTAAHVCHFPNFQKKGMRTKITFIQEDIKQEMNFFIGRYRELMNLSYWKYLNPDNVSLNIESFPDAEYVGADSDSKGFLDVEWEFVDGGIESTGVRKYIERCSMCDGESEYLTIAFCHEEPEINTAAALFLPDIVSKKQIPLFVYQPGGDQMIRVVADTPMYANIYPFGMKTDGFDIQYQERLLRARRIKYLYSLADKGDDFKSMLADKELVQPWFDTKYIFQQSNMYAANSIPFKLRSIANVDCKPLTDDEVDLLSETEHNRWNVERLLTGFRAYKAAERQKFIRALTSGNPDMIRMMKTEHNINKEWFKHKDIAPYCELLEDSKKYDKFIVRYIIKVL